MWLALKGGDHLTHRPDTSTHDQQIPFDLVNVVDDAARRPVEHSVLELLQPLAVILQNGKTMIDDGVKK